MRIFTTTVGKFQSCLMNIEGKGSHAERLQFQRENGRRADFSRGPQQIQGCCVRFANDFPGRALEWVRRAFLRRYHDDEPLIWIGVLPVAYENRSSLVCLRVDQYRAAQLDHN